IICKPNKNTTPVKTFRVDVDHAIAQAKFAGFKSGASSYPHGFGNVERIRWNVQNCDAKNAILNEYPVYWDTAKKDWEKEKKTNAQGKTPIRVVYANQNGGVVYCGLMVHTTVEGKDFAMSRDFKKCE
ncbi:Ribonuclease/ribotoxin, partial [Tricladium varicosporioides]